MEKKEIKNVNKSGWNTLSKSTKNFSNASLPQYGYCLERTEKELNLFDKVSNSKVLDIGCGTGKSLKYLLDKGAKEVWGVDISENQIEKTKKLISEHEERFIVAGMEDELDVPKNYFDYVYSIFSIGYTSDLNKTLNNIHSYLNEDGYLIISWTHPFYNCLNIKNNDIVLDKSYFDEQPKIIKKSSDNIDLVQSNMNISTMVNSLVSNGFIIEKILEEKTNTKLYDKTYKSRFFQEDKNILCPTTIIFKCKKRA